MKIFLALMMALFCHTLASVLTTGSRCSAEDPCPEPLSCVGNPTNLRCFMKKELGMRCGQDPFWVCIDGLTCVEGICTSVAGPGGSCGERHMVCDYGLVCDDGVCKTVVDTAGRCNAPNTVCAEPLSCVGNAPNLRCFMKKELGMRCGKDPFWVCAEGLECSDGICV